MDSMEEYQSSDTVDVINSEEIPDHFVCCVCLDLLYKPIVLRICQMLHFLLLKLYPITYKKREDQILEEEKKVGHFSPEFNGHAHESQADGERDHFRSPPLHSSAYLDSPSTRKERLSKPTGQADSHYNGTTPTKENSDGDLNQIKPVVGEEKDQASIADLLCTACKQLLFRPIVLNCGHVYCQTCIIFPADERLRCQVCECLHPRGFPKVCLTLDQFLAAKFPGEYALRKDAVRLKQVSSTYERATTCSMEACKEAVTLAQLPSRDRLPFSVQSSTYTHIGAGCDGCGMSPIVGDRYKCKDCTEKIGFNLCGDCYNTRPKLPGRFNQRHTPEHKFELIKRDVFRRLRLMTEQLETIPHSFLVFEEASETIPRALSGGSQENTSYNLAAPSPEDDTEDEDDALFTY